MLTEQFKQEVEKELTEREAEPREIIYFKLYQSQMPVIERAIETPALMLRSDRSRGYCLEMICTTSWREPTWTMEIRRWCLLERDSSGFCPISRGRHFWEA
jgi:hypothetical protein